MSVQPCEAIPVGTARSDHNWAVWSAKKCRYEVFGDYVIAYFKRTNRRLKLSEHVTRAARDELAAQQQAAINSFTQEAWFSRENRVSVSGVTTV